MKLLIQADDFGMTVGVADGIVASGRDGLLTQTGLFTNMPSSEYAVRRYKAEIPHVLLGQDLNLSTGRPLSDPEKIPSLVQEDGSFLTSKMHRALQEKDPGHVRYEEAYLEYDTQVQRFIELVGRKPGYIVGHAFHNEITDQALKDIREKYGCRNSYPRDEIEPDKMLGGWVKPVLRADKSYDYSPLVQLENDPLQMFIEGQLKNLEKYADQDVVMILHTHAGFLDRDLYKLSSFNAVRPMEAGFICSRELREFVTRHQIQMINAEYFD